MTTKLSPLNALDEDLEAACMDRHEAWRRLATKGSPVNQDAYDEASAEVDGLLDMRFQMMTAERIVSA